MNAYKPLEYLAATLLSRSLTSLTIVGRRWLCAPYCCGFGLSTITSLKYNYEQELDLWREVMECAKQGRTVLNQAGKFVYVNGAFVALIGHDIADILGYS